MSLIKVTKILPAARTSINTVNNMDESVNQKWVMGSMSVEMDGSFILYLFYIIETVAHSSDVVFSIKGTGTTELRESRKQLTY